MASRTIFFVSDQTGVTAETMGKSLLTQFDEREFQQITLPFVDTVDKADSVVRQINAAGREQGQRPIVFGTLIHDHLRAPFQQVEGLFLDFFATFLGPLEQELQAVSSHTVGRAHGMSDDGAYDQRIEATNYALNYDDGGRTSDYARADIILIGVSRSGKTPTCLYLALSYGIFAANYPLSEEELESGRLPDILVPYRERLFGLSITPERLQKIRKERRRVGKYSSIQQVRYEIREAESLYRRFSIPFIDTTQSSIEEIASTILSSTGIERRVRP